MARTTKPTLGSLMRALRERFGLTLKEMSTRTGVPFSTLAKVEHDRLTLTYDKLQMISDRLNIRMSELFAGPDEESAAVVNGRRSLATHASALQITTPNYDYVYMSPELRNKAMIPMLARMKARSLDEFGPLIRHHGEEFAYVIKGEIVLHTEFYSPVTLRAGDGFYIDSTMGHAYLAVEGAEEPLIVGTCSARQEELLDNAKAQTGASQHGASSPAPAARPRGHTASAKKPATRMPRRAAKPRRN